MVATVWTKNQGKWCQWYTIQLFPYGDRFAFIISDISFYTCYNHTVITFIIITPPPIVSGTGYCFRSISLFIYFFVWFFVSKITRKWLDRFAWNFQGRCGVTMGRPDYIFAQFWETTQCRDAQHRDGVCCAIASQLVSFLFCLWYNKSVQIIITGSSNQWL